MKTILLFLTIILVGSGWTFIKHIFSDREKKLFLIAIPLQLLVYVATVSQPITVDLNIHGTRSNQHLASASYLNTICY